MTKEKTTREKQINTALHDADEGRWVEFTHRQLGTVKVPKWLHLNGHDVDKFTQLWDELKRSELITAAGGGGDFVARRWLYKVCLSWVKHCGTWDVKGFDLDELITNFGDREKENAALIMWLSGEFDKYTSNFF